MNNKYSQINKHLWAKGIRKKKKWHITCLINNYLRTYVSMPLYNQQAFMTEKLAQLKKHRNTHTHTHNSILSGI